MPARATSGETARHTAPSRLLAELQARIAEQFEGASLGDEAFLDYLDDVAKHEAHQLFAANPTFGPYYTSLLSLDYNRHPWAGLLVASAVPEVANPSVQAVADERLEDAWEAFLAAEDPHGPAYVNFVRGKRHLYKGRLDLAASFYRLAREVLEEKSPVHEMAAAYLAFEAFQKGDLTGGRQIAAEALALARLRETRRPEGFAQLLLAFFALYEGAFARAEAELLSADAIYRSIDEESDRIEHPLVLTALGALYAFRESHPAAERCFASALELSYKIPGAIRYAMITLAVRAEFTAHRRTRRAVEDSAKACEFWPDARGGLWRTWTIRANGVAARFAKNLPESRRLLERALSEKPNPLERGRTHLELGKTFLELARSSPDEQSEFTAASITALHDARKLFEAAGARYWLTETYLLLADADHGSEDAWQGRARATSEDDPAFRWLFIAHGRTLLGPAAQLRISVHGTPEISIGELRPGFATKHSEKLIYALALSPNGEEEREVLALRLWPTALPTQAVQKLRTALWQAKMALGSEAWRLERQGDRLTLELSGVFVDHHAARVPVERVVSVGNLIFTERGELPVRPENRQIKAREVRERRLDETALHAERALPTLELPLLLPWKDEAWVRALNEERDRLVSSCRAVLAAIHQSTD